MSGNTVPEEWVIWRGITPSNRTSMNIRVQGATKTHTVAVVLNGEYWAANIDPSDPEFANAIATSLKSAKQNEQMLYLQEIVGHDSDLTTVIAGGNDEDIKARINQCTQEEWLENMIDAAYKLNRPDIVAMAETKLGMLRKGEERSAKKTPKKAGRKKKQAAPFEEEPVETFPSEPEGNGKLAPEESY